MDMTPEHLSLSILTPFGLLARVSPCDLITLPGIEGELGVMVGHTPLITILKSGPLRVIHDDKEVVFEMLIYREQKAFVDINPTEVTITLEEFCPLLYPSHYVGEDFFQSPLTIDSEQYGMYKMDKHALFLLSGQNRPLVTSFMLNHPGTYISPSVLKEIS